MILTFFSLMVNAKIAPNDKQQVLTDRIREYLASNPDFAKTKKAMADYRKMKLPPVGIALHRAANEFAPENSLPAMEIALLLEADYLEIDVRLTKDGHSVILHDGNLNRTTDGTGPLKEKTLEEVRALSAGKWFDPCYSAVQIPTLEEACQLLANHNKKGKHKSFFYVDCKDINANYLIETLRKYELLDGSVFYVNELKQIGMIRELAPNAKILPGLRDKKELEKLIETLHPYALDADWNDLDKDMIDRAHAKGVKIFSDGFGNNMNVVSYTKAIQAGIDVISTNQISVICEAIKKM